MNLNDGFRIIMIQKTIYAKHHIVAGIKKAYKNPSLYNMDVAEFGVKDGESLRIIEEKCKDENFPYRKLWGFDSFEGFPEESPNAPKLHDWFPGKNKVADESIPKINSGECIKIWFSELSKEIIEKYDIRPFSFIHLDSDLYISCIQACEWLFDNNLVIPGTIIAFDEFKSTETLGDGGESKAWFELSDKYKIESEEFFRNIFLNYLEIKRHDNTIEKVLADNLEWWQNSIIIKSIGQKSECKLLER